MNLNHYFFSASKASGPRLEGPIKIGGPETKIILVRPKTKGGAAPDQDWGPVTKLWGPMTKLWGPMTKLGRAKAKTKLGEA